MLKIRCSRCGKAVPYDYKNFINIADKPVCNECYYGKKQTMTEYLNSLTPLRKQLDEIQEALNEKTLWQKYEALKQENEKLLKQRNAVMATNIKYYNALEEIKDIASPHCSQCVEIINKVNEALK